jgi:purine-binding chemotaxis protein CheW
LNKYVLFAIGAEEFGIEIGKIVEIVRAQTPTPLPDVPPYIEGVINLRGTVIPLIDLRKRMGVEAHPEKERIIIIKVHGEKIGILVDEVKEIVRIDEDKRSKPPSIVKGLKPEYLSFIGKISDRLVIILNIDKLLTSEEMILLRETKEAILSEEQKRVDDQKER